MAQAGEAQSIAVCVTQLFLDSLRVEGSPSHLAASCRAPPFPPPHTPFRWVLFQSRCREHLSLGISRLHTCSGAREARCGRDLLLPCPGRSSMLGAVGFPGSADRPCGDGARPFGPQRPQSAFLLFFLCSLVHNSLGKKVSLPPLYCGQIRWEAVSVLLQILIEALSPLLPFADSDLPSPKTNLPLPVPS